MKNFKLLAASIGIMVLMATGCAEKSETVKTTEVPVTQETAAATQTETQAADDSTNKTNQMHGTMGEIKDFMIIVESDEDGESYVFGIEDDTLLKDLKTGDEIIVTYEGDITIEFDNLTARGIEKK